ncbi:MAG: carotenoid 1,2-hydratase, partial [Pseudomonadota bacterium]
LYDMERRDGTARSLGFRIGRDGRVADFEPPARQDLPMGFWRVRRATRAEEGGARLVRKLEDAPFYARAELETHLLGERVPAVHESLDLDRLRLPVVRAMLPFRMPRIWW